MEEKPRTGKSRAEYINRYSATHYDRIIYSVAKGRKAVIKDHAASQGENITAFISRAIQETMERDNAK
jgi:hypothetical protein